KALVQPDLGWCWVVGVGVGVVGVFPREVLASSAFGDAGVAARAPRWVRACEDLGDRGCGRVGKVVRGKSRLGR
ncbi:hypothetical protein NSK11_contig00293-0003, partial [Nocardia seriolae]